MLVTCIVNPSHLKLIFFRYETYYQRFKNIFGENKHIPRYFIPGNHDIGYVLSGLYFTSTQLSN